MNKKELLSLVDSLNLPETEYCILSGGSLLFHGLREETADLDLCVSNELFNLLKSKYNLTDENKNPSGFYKISEKIEVIPDNKENFKIEFKDDYPIESLDSILNFKLQSNLTKDKADIENIQTYLNLYNSPIF